MRITRIRTKLLLFLLPFFIRHISRQCLLPGQPVADQKRGGNGRNTRHRLRQADSV